MTLASDILALAPVLYWPLNDATAPAAADASGHGHTGVYGGPFALQQYGMIPGTLTAQFGVGGSVTTLSFPQLAGASFSVVWWMSCGANNSGVLGPTVGQRNAAGNRGWQWAWNTVGQNQLQAWNASGVVQSMSLFTQPIWNRWWHGYACVYTTGVGFVMYFDDGGSVAMGKTDWASTLSTDPFGWFGQSEAVVQNIAYFDKILSVPQINALLAYKYVWPFGPLLNATWCDRPTGGSTMLSSSDPIVIAQTQDLTDIRQAVRRTYP